MEENKQRTKDHYDGRTLELNRKLGNESDMIILRKFHNKIKRALLMKFAWKKNLLIDIGCGRGGDLYKWIDTQVKTVIGLDLSALEIDEAKSRFSQIKSSGKKDLPSIEFVQNDRLDTEQVSLGLEGMADIVTCMFVIHYFFAQESGIKQLLNNISTYLKPGGYFVCCFPDGKRILSLLKGSNSERVTTPCMEIVKYWQNECQCFGSAYTFSLKDTVTEITKQQPPFEYLVFFNVLEKLCADVGLFPVYEYDQNLENLFEENDRGKAFKHFRPDDSYRHSDPSLSGATQIYVAVVMIKK